MTETEVYAAIESYFEANWSETPIFYDQVPAKMEEAVSSSEYWEAEFGEGWEEAFGEDWDGRSFVALRIFTAGTVQVSTGSTAEWRGACIIQVEINIPLRTGTRRAVKLGDQVSVLFLGKDLSGVTVRDKVTHQRTVGNFYRRVIRFNGFYAYTH